MNNANMPKERGMVKWNPFTAMPEQFAGCNMKHKFVGTASLCFFLFAANLCFQDLKSIFKVVFKCLKEDVMS